MPKELPKKLPIESNQLRKELDKSKYNAATKTKPPKRTITVPKRTTNKSATQNKAATDPAATKNALLSTQHTALHNR